MQDVSVKDICVWSICKELSLGASGYKSIVDRRCTPGLWKAYVVTKRYGASQFASGFYPLQNCIVNILVAISKMYNGKITNV